MMPQSIFTGLSLASRRGEIEIRYPGRIHNVSRAEAVAEAHRIRVRPLDAESWTLLYAGVDTPCPHPLKAFFAELNGYPPPYTFLDPDRLTSGAPLVSCVVVINENALFVREQLLPSLVANSGRHPIEIVLVYNGSECDDPAFGQSRRVRSDWGAVSTGYNAGARESRGQYLAFFHDDCIVDDASWIEKCVDALARGVDAVAGEYRRMDTIAGVGVPGLPIAKSVPLFIRKDDFLEAGGYDEFHYVGYEDLDLTLALVRQEKKLAAADIRMRHFNGMSSTLKYCPVPGLQALYAMTALPRHAVRQRFKEFAEQGFERDGINYLQMALDVQLLYVLKKYRKFLAGIDREAYARAQSELERRVTTGCPFDATLILPRFRQFDRERWQAAQGPA